MFEIIKKIVKKIIFAFVVLYGLNVIVSSINIFIPINLFTITVVSLLGIPGLLSLISIFFIISWGDIIGSSKWFKIVSKKL